MLSVNKSYWFTKFLVNAFVSNLHVIFNACIQSQPSLCNHDALHTQLSHIPQKALPSPLPPQLLPSLPKQLPPLSLLRFQ